MHKIIAIVGMCGAGKSIVSDYFVNNHSFEYVRFGQITLDEVKRLGLAPTEENERPIRESFRKEHGMAAFAILNIPKFDEALIKGNLIADGLYSWAEYKVLKEYYKERLIVLAVIASPKIRYERLDKRILEKSDTNLRNRRFTPEQAKARDYAEIENSDKGGPIAMADHYLLNEENIEELNKQLERLYQKIIS